MEEKRGSRQEGTHEEEYVAGQRELTTSETNIMQQRRLGGGVVFSLCQSLCACVRC